MKYPVARSLSLQLSTADFVGTKCLKPQTSPMSQNAADRRSYGNICINEFYFVYVHIHVYI